MQNNDVKQLIQSIRSQTDKLKNSVKNTVPSKPSVKTSTSKKNPSEHQQDGSEGSSKHYSFKNSIQKEPIYVYQTPHGEEKANDEELSFLTPKITNLLGNNEKGNKNANKSPQITQNAFYPKANNSKHEAEGKDATGSDIQQMKRILQNLASQNETLTCDLRDFKKALELMINSYRKIQRELEEEKRRNARFKILEFEIGQEKDKNQKLREKNSFLKSKYLKLIETAHQYCLENDQEFKDMEVDIAKLESENYALKEVLCISYSNEKEVCEKMNASLNELEKAALDERNNSSTFSSNSFSQDWLDDFRKVKEDRKNMKILEEAKKKEKEQSSNHETINIATFGMVDMMEEKLLEGGGEASEVNNLHGWKAGSFPGSLKSENGSGEGKAKAFDAKSFLSSFKN